MKKGIIAGLGSGIFWGLSFLVPNILSSFSVVEIVAGRFLFFGTTSLIFVPRAAKLFISLSPKDRLLVIALSITGFCLYSLCVFAGVKYTDGVISSLIIGTIPIIIVLLGKPKLNRSLFSGLVLILFGLFFLLVFPALGNFATITSNLYLTGLLLLAAALLMWVWFAIYNTKFLQRNPKINTIDYTSLIGIINLIIVSPIVFLIDDFSAFINNPQISSYLLWTAILGIGTSWIANGLWALCSRNCPLSVSGILIISETVFGLTYSFIFQQRLPYLHETLAITLLIMGVIMTIRSQQSGRVAIKKICN